MLAEFKGFLTKSNAMALAIGVIIGAATGKVVTKLVEDLIMPIVGIILRGMFGRFFGATLQFLLQRPIRVLVDEASDIGKAAARRRASVIEPADNFLRQGILGLAGPEIGLRPVAGARRGDHGERDAIGALFGAG